MIDTHIPVLQNSSNAEAACKYLLDRIVRDRDFGWLMWHTQGMALLLAAEGDRRGMSPEDVAAEVAKQSEQWQPLLKRHGVDRPRVVVLEEKLDKLQELQREEPDLFAVSIEPYSPPRDRCDCERWLLSEEECVTGICDTCFAESAKRRGM